MQRQILGMLPRTEPVDKMEVSTMVTFQLYKMPVRLLDLCAHQHLLRNNMFTSHQFYCKEYPRDTSLGTSFRNTQPIGIAPPTTKVHKLIRTPHWQS